MVRNFKGVVKISEVQEEFDNLLNQINNTIDTYNASLDYEDIDYNNVGPELAPINYTLSIGGLKSVLNAYNGAVLGANVLRLSEHNYVVSEGVYIKNDGVVRLPSKTITGEGDTLYYDVRAQEYSFNSSPEGKVYTDTLGRVVFPAGTYPVTVFDSQQGHINTEVTFETSVAVPSYLTNETTNLMQTSTCKMTSYATYPQQYTWNDLSPDCLVDSTSIQQGDILYSDSTGVAIDDRSSFVAAIPQTTGFGSKVVYGIKLEIEFSEISNTEQTFSLALVPSDSGTGNYVTFNGWKLKAYAFDENGTLIQEGDVQIGSASSSNAPIFNIPSGTKKLTVCTTARADAFGAIDLVGNLYNNHCLIKINNPIMITYVNLDVDSCLSYDEVNDEYSVDEYVEGFNSLLGSGHFTSNTNTLEYILLANGEISVGNLKICKLNNNRISRLCNTQDALNEDIPDYDLKLQSKAVDINAAAETIDNSEKGQFVGGFAGVNSSCSLFGQEVSRHIYQGGNERQDSYWEPYNCLFLPKGVSNPFTYNPRQRVWDYILQRPNRS